MEGGSVIIVNSQQTLVTIQKQKTLVQELGEPDRVSSTPAAQGNPPPQGLPLSSIVIDVHLEATLTASKDHCHRASKPVTKTTVQRSQTSSQSPFIHLVDNRG